jgi:cell division protein FtsZ
MLRENIEGVHFVAVNTDAQALRNSGAETTIQIGANITKGLGAGANPDVGREAALENRDEIRQMLTGSDMVFIAAGMGGGTGTGAAPVIAEVAKELGILTVAVVTKPFNFEGKKRMSYALQGIDELSKHVDSLITIPNDKLLKVLGRGVSLLDAFKAANNVLLGAVQGIAELITRPGLINVDFADVRTVMREMGTAMMVPVLRAVMIVQKKRLKKRSPVHCWKISIWLVLKVFWLTSRLVLMSPWKSLKLWVTQLKHSLLKMQLWLLVQLSIHLWKMNCV